MLVDGLIVFAVTLLILLFLRARPSSAEPRTEKQPAVH